MEKKRTYKLTFYLAVSSLLKLTICNVVIVKAICCCPRYRPLIPSPLCDNQGEEEQELDGEDNRKKEEEEKEEANTVPFEKSH